MKDLVYLKYNIGLLIVIVSSSLFFSCGQDKPTISYSRGIDTTSFEAINYQDTTKLLISELPVKFDSTDVLLFAIELVDLQERGGYSSFGSSYKSSDVGSNYFNDLLAGDFINIVFQDKNGNETKLTDRKIKIRSVNFLREIFIITEKGYLLYSISDRDSNGDKELNQWDLEALYISKIDGSGFTKLTKELHELYDWNVIKSQNRVYYRTLEDENRDGQLNNKDKFHYYFLEFIGDSYAVMEYNPLKILE